MASITDIICAKTDKEREAARAALAKANADAASDNVALAGFLKNCTTMEGKPLGLDERGRIVTFDS